MAISTAFNEELAVVDGTKSFTFTINTGTHTENEFSVAGYTVTAGSDAAAEHGAVEALYELGYRFWTPYRRKRPGSLPSGGVTIAKTQRSMPFCRMYYNYSFHPLDPTNGSADFDRFVVLNGCDDDRRPVGHAWGTWYNDDTAWFNANPSYWSLVGSRVVFDLANATAFEQLAQRAAFWIDNTSYLNAFNRGAWDAPDGDTLGSDLVWPWAARVVAILRSTYSITDAELGVYAYAGHRDYRGVAGEDLTGVYGQVALGFNDLGEGYPSLVDGWGNALGTGMLSLRGYGDIAAQGGYRIPYGASTNLNFLLDYPSFITSGANGVNFETSGNWIKNVISHYTMMRVWAKGGTPATIFASVLSEYIADQCSNDSAVADLYNLWGKGGRENGFVLRQSMQIVDSMTGAHKERYLQFMALQTEFERAILRQYDGPYFTGVEKAMRWAEWLYREDGSVHNYSIQRQEAGVGRTTNQGRADLDITGSPQPHYFRFPAAPTTSDINNERALLERDYAYPEVAEPSDDMADWVEVTPPTPAGLANGSFTDANAIATRYTARFIYSGPGNVTITNTDATGTANVTSYGSGLHDITVIGEKTVTWSAGNMYLIPVPTVFVESLAATGNGGVLWAFLPPSLTGWHLIEASSRLSIYDEDGRHDCRRRDDDFATWFPPQDLKTGTVCVFHQTTGEFTLAGANPAISTSRTTMLMPRSLAEREGLI